MTRRASTWVVACAALVGFASNSLLCRAALAARDGVTAIDAASFTAIRMVSGAVVLAAIVFARKVVGVSYARLHDEPPDPRTSRGSWASAIALFAYAIAFSVAYLRVTAATGALILFAAVQVSMIGIGIVRGNRPRPLEWLGLAIASVGLVALLLPGLASPDPMAAIAMAIAGASWGVYSIRGAGATDPLAVTADNFLRTVPLAAIVVGAMLVIESSTAHATPYGIALAAMSGALASGIGYSLWYAALPYLAPTRAAIIQLGVPVLTAAAAVVLLGEPLSLQFALASATIVGGIAIAIVARSR